MQSAKKGHSYSTSSYMRKSENYTLFKWQFLYEGLLNKSCPFGYIDFRYVKIICETANAVNSVSPGQILNPKMPF